MVSLRADSAELQQPASASKAPSLCSMHSKKPKALLSRFSCSFANKEVYELFSRTRKKQKQFYYLQI